MIDSNSTNPTAPTDQTNSTNQPTPNTQSSSTNQNNPVQSILESRQTIAALDKSNMLASIEELGKQIEQAWEDTRDLNIARQEEIRNVVIAGMGGSGLGADVIKSLFKEELAVPLEIVHEYTLPQFVNQHTLVILASYSGGTEEIIACAEDARQKQAQITVICAGGELANIARQNNYPVYEINALHNPSGQPRMAVGYAIFGTIAILEKAGIISLSHQQVEAVVKAIDRQISECTVEVDHNENPAKALAYTMIDRRPIIIASEFLEGSAHVATNQLHENSKIYADYKIIPEMNHHLLEGLKFPDSNANNHIFIFIESQLYRLENIIRIQLSQKTVANNHVETIAIPMRASTKIEQAFEMIVLFSFAGLYLAMLENIDPSPIPFVEQFKTDLKARKEELGST